MISTEQKTKKTKKVNKFVLQKSSIGDKFCMIILYFIFHKKDSSLDFEIMMLKPLSPTEFLQ